MKSLKVILIALLVVVCINKSKAQQFFDCVDTFRVNPYYLCSDPTYQPVCGCNGVTYRNFCVSYYAGGVNYTVNGTCENFGFDILENPVATNMTISVYNQKSERVIIQAWNDMGNFIYEFSFNSYQNSVQQFFIDTHDWQRGVYIINVLVGGQKQSKKLVVANSN